MYTSEFKTAECRVQSTHYTDRLYKEQQALAAMSGRFSFRLQPAHRSVASGHLTFWPALLRYFFRSAPILWIWIWIWMIIAKLLWISAGRYLKFLPR